LKYGPSTFFFYFFKMLSLCCPGWLWTCNTPEYKDYRPPFLAESCSFYAQFIQFSSWREIEFYHCLFCIFCYDHKVLVFHFVDAVYHIDLHILNYPYIPGMNPTWSWWIIFLIYCCIWLDSIFLKVFCTYFDQEHWPVVFFFVCVLSWFLVSG
jgi:hypothetical protein